MTSPQGNPARREPLLWLQLLGLAALPLEAAGLLLILAGADPGPLPGLDRLFAWTLGALGPAVLFWKLPPDLWSLLLLQVPLRGRRPEQLRLSALQTALPLKLLGAAGALLLLPLLWWSDAHAGVAWAWSPLSSSPRLVVLLLAALMLSLMLWQWQQLVQALWMLSRPAARIAETLPLSSHDAAERRLNVGLPLLLLDPLPLEPAAATTAPKPKPEAAPQPEQAPEQELEPEAQPEPAESIETAADAPPEAEPEPQSDPAPESALEPQAASDAEPEPEPEPAAEAGAASVASLVDVAVAPEQGAEEGEGADLNQQI